jgi:hypothetical protein
MLAFAVGAALPLTLIGTISAKTLANRRRAMATIGARGRAILGAALAIAGMLILTGVDHRIEAALTTTSPDWLVAVTTRY